MYTGKAYDLGRGERSDPMFGVPKFVPGPGRYEAKSDFNKDEAKRIK